MEVLGILRSNAKPLSHSRRNSARRKFITNSCDSLVLIGFRARLCLYPVTLDFVMARLGEKLRAGNSEFGVWSLGGTEPRSTRKTRKQIVVWGRLNYFGPACASSSIG